MDRTAVWLAIFSLIGVALGAAGSFLGVLYAQRTARDQMRLQRASQLREERKEVLLGYLRSVENSWAFLDGLWGKQPITSLLGEPLSGEAVDREAAIRNHEVWYHQEELLLVSSDPVRRASMEFSRRIYEATFHRERIDQSLWHYLSPARDDFLIAAREELCSIDRDVGRWRES